MIEFLPTTKDVKDTKKSSRAEGTLALYISKHNSLSHIDHLFEVLKKYLNDSPVAANLKISIKPDVIIPCYGKFCEETLHRF